MSYSERFKTKDASDAHDQRIKWLKEIQEQLEKDTPPNLFVLEHWLARVIEILVEELQ